MKKIAVITDTNSGITPAQAKELGVGILPMPFSMNGEMYYEGLNLSREEFYTRLQKGVNIFTSQPSMEAVAGFWSALLVKYDEIVHIPMSSGLSGACETAQMLSKDFAGKVQVVDNQRISVVQRQSVIDAKRMADNGRTAKEIKKILEDTKLETSIYIMLNTLKYLKKGGRITPAAAALGSFLKIKPVLQIQGDKLDAFAKARTIKHAKTIMIEAIKNDIKTRFSGNSNDEKRVCLQIAHTNNEDAANEFKKEIMKHFPGYEIYMDHLSLSVACHIGPGSLAFACTKKIDI